MKQITRVNPYKYFTDSVILLFRHTSILLIYLILVLLHNIFFIGNNPIIELVGTFFMVPLYGAFFYMLPYAIDHFATGGVAFRTNELLKRVIRNFLRLFLFFLFGFLVNLFLTSVIIPSIITKIMEIFFEKIPQDTFFYIRALFSTIIYYISIPLLSFVPVLYGIAKLSILHSLVYGIAMGFRHIGFLLAFMPLYGAIGILGYFAANNIYGLSPLNGLSTLLEQITTMIVIGACTLFYLDFSKNRNI